MKVQNRLLCTKPKLAELDPCIAGLRREQREAVKSARFGRIDGEGNKCSRQS
jgi:hypothetical protein